METSTAQHDGSDQELAAFAALIIGFGVWIVLVVVFFPRFLGRLLAFCVNRAGRGAFYTSIPTLHIYPLAGRIVAHSVRYTSADLTVSVEEFVLQCRWWRRYSNLSHDQVLAADTPDTLSPTALAQQRIDRENSARFLKRLWYRLRRWWQRAAVTKDGNNPNESNSLISLIFVGLRVRAVNNTRNYNHVKNLLDEASRMTGDFNGSSRSDIRIISKRRQADSNEREEIDIETSSYRPSKRTHSRLHDSGYAASEDASSSDESIDGKSFSQRLFELTSIRINDGAFYFCDMGESPLIRLTVNTAKIRYRCGLPDCDIDISRKFIFLTVSSIRLSVASNENVSSIVGATKSQTPGESSNDDSTEEHNKDESCDERNKASTTPIGDNTERMLHRIIDNGHRGVSDSFWDAASASNHEDTPSTSKRSFRANIIKKFPSIPTSNSNCEKRERRKNKTLACVDLLYSSTAVIEYVFDEPGPTPESLRRKLSGIPPESGVHIPISQVSSTDANAPLPPPKCSLVVHLNGAEITYDAGAFANLQRVQERFQPVLYDHMLLAEEHQSDAERRMVEGMHVQIVAKPKSDDKKIGVEPENTAILRIPFSPQPDTWISLLSTKVRNWDKEKSDDPSAQKGNANEPNHTCPSVAIQIEGVPQNDEQESEAELPASHLDVQFTNLSVQAEIPFRSGVGQKLILSLSNPDFNSRGIVDMPLLKSKKAVIKRETSRPVVWNEEHFIDTNVHLYDSELLYVPDFLRVIGDISATIQKQSNVVPSVSHFVPYRETINIFAEDKYCITQSCGRDNAWADVDAGVADEYGKLKLRGNRGKLQLRPTVSPKYNASVSSMSWSLSLPDAHVFLEFLMPSIPEEGQDTNTSSSKTTDSSRVGAGHYRVRAPSLTKRVRAQIDTTEPQARTTSTKESKSTCNELEIIQFTGAFDLKGKVLANEKPRYLTRTVHSFLDAVNINDISFHANSLTFDLNPCHITHILNLIRNYAGPGTHTISTSERATLDALRNSIADKISNQHSYPDWKECLALGLSPGYTLPGHLARPGKDDLFHMSFEIDSGVVRLHELPHPTCPFDFSSKKICSIVFDRLFGKLTGNRLGSELVLTPSSSRPLSLYGGCLSSASDLSHSQIGASYGRTTPKLTFEGLEIRKKSFANENWSSYSSMMTMSIGKVFGCIMDTSMASLSRMATTFIPDGVHECISSVSSLLSIDTIELVTDCFDILVLSPSSTGSAKNGAQNHSLNIERKDFQHRRASLSVPKFLTGVTQLCMLDGFRIVSSSLGFDTEGSLSRIVLPSIAFDILVPSGGKLSPWVDEATLRAQVAHATLPRRNSSQEIQTDSGVLCRALEVRRMTIELVYSSRTSYWTPSVPSMQMRHVLKQHQTVRSGTPDWCSRNDFKLSKCSDRKQGMEDLRSEWWDFLRNSEIAKIIQRHRRGRLISRRRADTLSMILPAETLVFIAPEILELVAEISIRAKEFTSRYDLIIRKLTADNTVRFDQRKGPGESVRINPDTLSSDLLALWTEFEKNKQPNWVVNHDQMSPGSSFKAFETQGVKFLLHSPKLQLDTRERDSFTLQRFSEDEIFASVPSGIQIFKELRFQVNNRSMAPSSANNLNPRNPNLIRTSVVYGHTSEVNLGCNDVPLFKIKKVLLVNRERNGLNRLENSDNQKSFLQRDRKTVVGKIESVHIGHSPANLNSYAVFGRLASVFLLMIRVVSVEMDALSETNQSRLSVLCRTIMSCSPEDFMSKDPDQARTYLVEALKFSHENKNETTLKKGFSSSILSTPNISNVRKRFDILIQTVVHSIDVTVQDMSFKIDDHEIAQSDIFSCRGGKTASKALDSTEDAELDGYVLNASFGTVSLSIRDDVAARSLRMVGKVASYIQKASFLIPLLRPSGRRETWKRNFDDVSSHSQSPSRGVDRSVLLNPSSPTDFHHSFRGRGMSETYGRRSFSTRRAPRRSRTASVTFQTPKYSRSPKTRPLSPGMNPTIYRPVSPEQSKSDRYVSPLFAISSDEISPRYSHSSNIRSPILAQGTSSTHSQGLSEPKSTDDDEESSDGFESVAIQTAGDVGPARKRSRTLIRVKPVVPPAFLEPIGDVNETISSRRSSEPLQRIPQSPTGNQSGPIFFESRADESVFITPPSRDDTQKKSEKPIKKTSKPNITLFVSCREIVSRYYRAQDLQSSQKLEQEKTGNITFIIHAPRITAMSHPKTGRYSLLFTASSAKLSSSNNIHCVLTGSIAQIGGTMSLSSPRDSSSLPKLLASCRVSEFKGTLLATDLRSVQKFRDDFETDLKGVLAAFFKTKHAVSEMARTTRLFTSKGADPTTFSTMSFDLIFQRSEIKLEGFHPNDVTMSISYVLDGIFFSVVASEGDNAALTLGLRLHGHGLLLSSPSWPGDEYFEFPSFDARGVQWGENIGLPTSLKLTTEPLVSLTSFQGLRHVLFTISGLLAFQKEGANNNDGGSSFSVPQMPTLSLEATDSNALNAQESQSASGATPFQRSLNAWERTKGVRMDISIRPIALSLASGQVVSLFNLDTVTGVVEWNKLAVSDVQLKTSVTVAKVALSFMRMPTAEFTAADVQNDDRRSSLSVVLEKSRIDLLKKQRDLTHTFIFRTNVSAVTGQVRPWRLLLDAAVWADEQEFVSDLQSINYSALSAARQRPARSQSMHENEAPTEHRLILFGANIQRVALAVPLVNSEQYSTSRLAIRATDLHFLARHRFDSLSKPAQHIFEVKSHFIGILWENNSLLSSHHAQITIGVKKASQVSSSHFGALNIVMVPGTWRICPRKDVVLAVLEAKNRKDNKIGSMPMFGTVASDSNIDSSLRNEESTSNITENESRLLVERLHLKVLRTSGFIEGLENEFEPPIESLKNDQFHRGRRDTAKVTVPAFSISMVRNPEHDFDLVDVDFSGREGEFPRGCLQRVSNLFSELFGAVALDQEKAQQQSEELTRGGLQIHSPQQQQQQREISRNLSILVRFGGSLYRAQEEANLSFESKFGFFASPHSALLVSVTTNPVAFDGPGHTTVISGISPRLVLEITPLLEGAEEQKLHLSDVRFSHGLCSTHPPYSIVHINKMSALIEAKTLMLAQSHWQLSHESLVPNSAADLSKQPASSPRPSTNGVDNAGRNLVFVLGKPRMRQKSVDTNIDATVAMTSGGDPSTGIGSISGGGKSVSEADVRLQLKLFSKTASETASDNQAGLAIERLHMGLTSSTGGGAGDMRNMLMTENFHCAVHKVIFHGQWDILMWKVRLKENLFCFDRTERLGEDAVKIGRSGVSNIINRLNVEYLQYKKRTLKLDIDALAARWEVPTNHIDIESTKVHSEVSHTLFKANSKLASQWKKLRNEVKLLSERETGRKGKQNANMLSETAIGAPVDGTIHSGASSPTSNNQRQMAMSSALPSSTRFHNHLLTEPISSVNNQDIAGHEFTPLSSAAVEQMQSEAQSTMPSLGFGNNIGGLFAQESGQLASLKKGDRLKVAIKGHELMVKMRGYQFDETRHSAMVSLTSYNIKQVRGLDAIKDVLRKPASSSNEHLVELRKLDVDFKEMAISYHDDERRICSELFKIPNPKLRLSVVDREEMVTGPSFSSPSDAPVLIPCVDVSLMGDLEVKLGYGFYNWQEFKDLFELTIHGIAPARSDEGKETGSGGVAAAVAAAVAASNNRRNGNDGVGGATASSSGGESGRSQRHGGVVVLGGRNGNGGETDAGKGVLWDGKKAVKILVKLNPRVDVIGDLTGDVLTMLAARLNKHVDAIPKLMFDYLVIPLEAFSKVLCDPLPC